MRLGAILLGCAILLPAAAARAQTRAALRAEIGAEYDTNATRAETVDGVLPPKVVGSALARAVVGGELSRRLGAAQDLVLSASVGGKAFAEDGARSEDVLVAQAAGSLRAWLGRRMSIGAGGSYFDAIQRGSVDPRDFRAGAASLRVGMRVGEGGSAALAAGYRWFTFKSDHAFDFQAPVVAADYRHVILTEDESAEWEVSAGASFEPRDFEGPRFVFDCGPGVDPGPRCVMPTAEGRRDRFGAGHVELQRVGAVLVGAGYALHVNRSQSYGESLLRHVFQVRASARLPLDFYLSGKLEALLTRYQDPIYLGTDPSMRPLSIDDETKDSVKLEATRDLHARLQLVARYAIYTNRIDTRTVHYGRQTFMLGLAFAVDR